MKKIISAVMALAVAASVSCVAFAETDSSITVNGRQIIFFEEQAPVIKNDRLYVPVRRVLETMGEKVSWDELTRTVTVDSKDNLTKLKLTIDNPEVTKYTFKSVLYADKETVMSDVAPVIINDRTMLPIRVIAESLGARVDWDENTYETTITTKEALELAQKAGADIKAADFDVAKAVLENLPKLSITAEKSEGPIKEGDEVTIKVAIKDLNKLYEGAKITSGSLGIEYNTDNFAYAGYKTVENGKEKKSFTGADNGTFYNHCAKVVFVNEPSKAIEIGEDGVFAEITFTALNDKGGEFKLANGITTVGNDIELVPTIDADKNYTTISSFDQLYIDRTPAEVK